jgi:hypothetical protein
MLNGMLMFVAVIFTFIFFSKLNTLDVYHKLVLILLFSIAVGLHGISHLVLEKEYDFMYICLDDDESPDSKCVPGWQWYNRNWDLAKLCLTTMCRDFHLKGIIVGRTNCEFTNYCSGIVKTVPFMDFFAFQREMQKCRFLFVPNISDASPRVMTEAMCYNMPVLTNYNIIGGWHNIVPGVTGEFFTDDINVTDALEKITKNYDSYRPREWYCANRGRNNSGKQLAKFLKENYPKINNPNLNSVRNSL